MADFTKRQQHLIDNPEWSLVTCLNSLFNAMRLVQAEKKGLLPNGLFSSDFVLVNDGDPSQGIRVKAAIKPVEPILLLENIMMNVAATCFLQYDELASQKLGGKGRFNHTNENLRNTCTVLYLVRCAFAHNPLIPTWLIDSRFRDKTYEIPAISLQLNTSGLHRTVGVIPKLGGWVSAIQLLQLSHKLISPTTAEAMELKSTS